VEPLEEKVACFIAVNRLFEGATHILLAVSGGADSIALLHAMQALVSREVMDADLVCVHVNHQLRGAASDGDQAFVVEQATELGLPVITKTIDVSAYAKEQKLSIETAGRQLRLACLGQVARDQDCTWIATDHQKNDNAETVLQRLRRGTGFRGLAGIWPSRQFAGTPRLARPLLDCERAEIVTYLQTQHLRWREDQTNADCAHTRNFIRHRLLPNLQSESSDSLVTALASLAAAAEKLHLRVREQAELAAARHTQSADERTVVDATVLASLPEMVAVELVRLQLAALGCGEQNLTQHHYRNILRLARDGTVAKALTLPGGFLACRERDRIVLQPRASESQAEIPTSGVAIRVPGTSDFAGYRIEARIFDGTESEKARIRDDKSPFLEYLDLDRVDRPLIVRARHQGDRFHPLGLAGKKKVGKFLTAAKVPAKLRREILVFEDRGKIVWLCPVRISERVKITEQTRRILALRVTDIRSPQRPRARTSDSAGDDANREGQ
jgi:tRNA(Ile)-lysidine synthase